MDLPSQSEALLDSLSVNFKVCKTKYGGRGCFAITDIPAGTLLLKSQNPVGSTVVRPFRKEVCTWCFNYLDGKTLKFRIDGKVYFCTQQCLEDFQAHDLNGVLSKSLCALETLYLQCEDEGDFSEPSDLEQEWADVAAWEEKTFSVKPSKRSKFYPRVNKEDYAEIRYIMGVLHTQYKDSIASENAEVRLFDLLQSAEAEKVHKYPYLGRSYINIYKFVRLISPPELLPYVSPQNVRDIIGRNLTNAFGIWSPITQPGEEREFFGFGVYPSGSFFNHSCASNVEKTRESSAYSFHTSTAVSKGSELCISYGVDDDDVVERRKALSEWFFTCGCMRCESEAKSRS